MVGRVGGDVFGDTLKDGLAAAGVDHTYVEVDTGVSSGVALITVEDSAENAIVAIPGANGRVGDQDLQRLERVLGQSRILLLQLEIPLEMVVAAAKAARERGVKVILDPAPAQAMPDELYASVDILTPNETEAGFLVGFPVESPEDAAGAARTLHERGVQGVIIKMGGRGALALIDGRVASFDAFPVAAVDTVAAGDAFSGALAVALSEGKSIEEAILWGTAGGALSVTKEGAQPAMPRRDELLALLRAHPGWSDTRSGSSTT